MNHEKPAEETGHTETPETGSSRQRFLEKATLAKAGVLTATLVAGGAILVGEGSAMQQAKTRKTTPLTTNVAKLLPPAQEKKLSAAAKKLTLADLQNLANHNPKGIAEAKNVTVSDLRTINDGLLDKIAGTSRLSEITIDVSCCSCCCCAVACMEPVQAIA